MNRPCKLCDAETFRVLHKLCARLTRKMPYALYLAALTAPDMAEAEEQCLRRLHGGEVLCNMYENYLYILLFAHTDEEAENTLYPVLSRVHGSSVRISRITQRLEQDPTYND